METNEQIEARVADEHAKLIADIVARASLPEGAEVDPTTLQARLAAPFYRPQRDPGDLEAAPAWVALSMIEFLGETFAAGDDPERAVVALGRLEIQSARLAALWRMTIEPVLELARLFQRRQEVQPLRAPAVLARAVHRAGYSRGDGWRDLIVEGIALCVAKGLDDCEVLHNLEIDPVALFEVMAKEELARAATPGGEFTAREEQWLVFFRRHGVAIDRLAPGTGSIPFHEVDEGNARADRDGERMARAAAGEPFYGEGKPEGVEVTGLGAYIPDTARTRGALEQLRKVADRLHDETPVIVFDPVAHLDHARICPLCTGLLHQGNDTLWRCVNVGCEFSATAEEMEALLERETQLKITT